MTEIWFISAAVLLFSELLLTGTFFLLPFAIGSFFAGVSSLISDNTNVQLSVFVIFIVIGVFVSLKIFGPERKRKNKLEFSDGVNKYIGKSFLTTKELDPYTSTSQHVFNDDWQVISFQQRISSETLVKVIKVDGTKLVVSPKEE